MNFNNVCNLNYRIMIWCWKLNSVSWYLNVERKNSQRCYLIIFINGCSFNSPPIKYVNFYLASALLAHFIPNLVSLFRNLQPTHTCHFSFNHKSQTKGNITFVSHFRKHTLLTLEIYYFFFEMLSQLIDVLGQMAINFQEVTCSILIVHDIWFLAKFDFADTNLLSRCY